MLLHFRFFFRFPSFPEFTLLKGWPGGSFFGRQFLVGFSGHRFFYFGSGLLKRPARRTKKITLGSGVFWACGFKRSCFSLCLCVLARRPLFPKIKKTLPRTNSTRAVFPTRFWDGFVGALQRGCGPWAKIFRNWKTHVFFEKGQLENGGAEMLPSCFYRPPRPK